MFESRRELHLRIAQSGRVLPSEGRGRRIEACYADHLMPLSSTVECLALTQETSDQHREGLPIPRGARTSMGPPAKRY